MPRPSCTHTRLLARAAALLATAAALSANAMAAETPPYDAGVALPSLDAAGLRLHVYANRAALETADAHISNAVIAIGQNPQSALYPRIAAAAADAQLADATLIVAIDYQPQAATARHLANWGQTDWAAGAVSTDRATASAFAVVDELLAVVADPKRYPHLRQITITGFGRGAELVLRHATASAAPEALARLNPPLQLNWVVASPDRYTYLDSSRWDAKRHAFTDRSAGIANGSEACRTLDDYPYGYRGAVPDYVASGLNAADRHDIAGRFLQRSVIYLVGANDSSVGDRGCQAGVQGSDANARSRIFFDYSRDLAVRHNGGKAPDTSSQFRCVVPAVAHQPSVYDTAVGRYALFFPLGNTSSGTVPDSCDY
ncbi:Conserved hypothetical secreted protein [Xanthomonas translucens pv. translucens DSM 18974]|nr:hypothetical protein BN444_03505 [Xanthomonas translucens pv. translucens DSM 18974]SCB03141.1 Conserved hypothetical secreted protein [Xanthomonas translucens pv. translucens DSM 18974]